MAVTVPRLFPDQTIVCLASGPSLTANDVDACRGKAPVVAVNDTYRLAPWADVLYACDAKWWDYHNGVTMFPGLKFSLEKKADRWLGVQVLERSNDRGLDLSPARLCTGMNSGYQAINLAVHLGARRILLLGYDMQVQGKRSHFFGDHPKGLQRSAAYEQCCERFASLVEPLKSLGVSVINCSRQSALKAFPRQPLVEALGS